ncbi:MAG: flagellar biosynthesis anti-sigma factor FlgM [Rhodoferax sp.]|nr:flagellar biosynthesis anti-sigma factor FlgM [Rhodoferax sp.]MCF8208391.1 flagellar biosynthesis anti-sigma factor FlgM [Rhodoferax sp.]
MKIGQSDYSASISQSNAANAAKTERNANASGTANAAATQTARSPSVAVTVSTLARGLEKASRAGADIDTQKVASVKASIEDGSYVVNAEAIADKLLSNAQEMLTRTKS